MKSHRARGRSAEALAVTGREPGAPLAGVAAEREEQPDVPDQCDGPGDRGQSEGRVADRGQLDHDDRQLGPETGGGCSGQPGLPDAARAGERHHPRWAVKQQGDDRGDLLRASEQWIRRLAASGHLPRGGRPGRDGREQRIPFRGVEVERVGQSTHGMRVRTPPDAPLEGAHRGGREAGALGELLLGQCPALAGPAQQRTEPVHRRGAREVVHATERYEVGASRSNRRAALSEP